MLRAEMHAASKTRRIITLWFFGVKDTFGDIYIYEIIKGHISPR